LLATDAYEDRCSPLQISNQVADEFVAERAQAWRSRS
jgi:hypothetical protein